MSVIIWHAHARSADWTCPGPSVEAIAFHRSLPDYVSTPLVDLPPLAKELGVGRVLAKDESSRLGLPAFKALGASWAIERTLRDHADDAAVTIVTATDGNHGRAVARFSRLLGHRARIFVPDGVHPSAVQAIRDEGAEVTHVPGSYDDAVATAAGEAEQPGAILVQDTAWSGYEQIPGWIVEGYATLFAEADEQMRDRGIERPDLVLVPAGVGSLLQAALVHYRSGRGGPAVVSVEPTAAACMAPSLVAGQPVTVDTGTTLMSGLNCGTPSSLAWPYIVGGLDAAVAVEDAAVVQAARDLALLGVHAGPCGAAGLAALREIRRDDERLRHLGLHEQSTVLLVVTEGADANPVPEECTA